MNDCCNCTPSSTWKWTSTPQCWLTFTAHQLTPVAVTDLLWVNFGENEAGLVVHPKSCKPSNFCQHLLWSVLHFSCNLSNQPWWHNVSVYTSKECSTCCLFFFFARLNLCSLLSHLWTCPFLKQIRTAHVRHGWSSLHFSPTFTM